jgi:hypothetical protein
LAIGTAVPIKMISCSRKSKKPLPGLLYLIRGLFVRALIKRENIVSGIYQILQFIDLKKK